MSRHAGWLIGAVLAALVCAFGLYLYTKAEPYEEVVEHGPSLKPRPILTWPPNFSCASGVSTSSTPTAWTCCPPWNLANTACCCWASEPT